MTNKQLIELLQKLPQNAEVYLEQDEFGYYYTFNKIELKNVGDALPDPKCIYSAIDTGKHINGIVIG